MKILHVITSLRIGGAEKLMVDLLPKLKQLGCEVDLLVFDGYRTTFYDQLEKNGIKIYALNYKKSVYHLSNFYKIIPYLKKYDYIHTHNTASQFYCSFAKLFFGGGILITTEHSTTNRRRNLKWMKYFDLLMYHQYKKIICISEQTKDLLLDHLPSLAHKVCVIYNGIDTQKYQLCKCNNHLLKLEGDYKILMTAAFRYQKDQKTLIKAVSYLPSSYHLYFAGDGEQRNSCEQLACDLKIANRVHFLGNRSDIPELLQSIDVVVQSSHIDGFCLAAVEGMAAGKPVIATDIPGLADVVRGAGILVPHEDEQTLASEIKKLITDFSFYEKTVYLCRSRAKEYTITCMAEKYCSLYI